MTLCTLEMHNVRNLAPVQLHPSPRFNLFFGGNGAGKTSVLEGIYLLSRGQSFRSAEPYSLVHHGLASCTVTAKTATGSNLGIELARTGARCRIDGREAQRAELAQGLPLLFIGPDSHRILNDGPQQRRRFLDWGAFHVEPRFLAVWRRYQRALKQRNMALRLGQALAAWDDILAEVALELDQIRRSYLDRLLPYAVAYVREFGDLDGLTLDYLSGWRHDASYKEVLATAAVQDRVLGYTRYGPHRGDLHIKLRGHPAREVVSRGQQKLLIYSLLLAQATQLQQVSGLRCVVLVDDLAAELDGPRRALLLDVLARLDSQIFITTVNDSDWPTTAGMTARFHVEQGRITRTA